MLPNTQVVGNPQVSWSLKRLRPEMRLTLKKRSQAGYFGSKFVTFADFKDLQDAGCAPGRDCLDLKAAAVAAEADADPTKMLEAGADLHWSNTLAKYEGPAQLACLDEHADDPLFCGAVPNYYNYMLSPMFVSEMTVDGYQLAAEGQLGRADSATPMGGAYMKYLSNILGTSLTANVINGPHKSRDGLWAPACTDHCMKWKKETRTLSDLSHWQVRRNRRCPETAWARWHI